MAARIITALSIFGLTTAYEFPDCVRGPLRKNGVCNTALSIPERAKALVNILSVPEKINLTGDESFGVPRIGLPAYRWWNEGLHGVASGHGVNFSTEGDFSYGTSFPQPILMGAAFDDEMIYDIATIISTEARAFSNVGRSGLDYWTPNINQFKDPRWGRGQETPGEDSFHLKSYVNHLVRGFEQPQNGATKKIIATCKHFIGYDLEDWQGNVRYEFDAKISEQDFFEFYAQPFQACARDSQVGSIMCSYNAVNGIPTCADEWLLQTVLREHWNWESDTHYVVSDCDAIQNVYAPHDYRSTREEAVAVSLIAGTDLDCGDYYPMHLPNAYSQGLVNDTILDQAVTRLIAAQLEVGFYDPPSASEYRSYGWSNVSTPEAETLARRAAEKGIVLLQNDGILPLEVSESKKQRWLLLGAWANATDDMQGNYPGIAPFLHSPLWAADRLPGVTTAYTSAVAQGDTTTNSWLTTLQMVKEADLVLIIDGINNKLEAETKDRNTIAWTSAQIDFTETIAALGKPLVLVQMGGGQLDDTVFLNNENISAIVWAGYPGQDGGPALMNVLTGAAAPAGRLSVTQYPASYIHSIPMTDMSLRPNEDTGSLGRTYRWFDKPVLPFGYGLHYTTFDVAISSAPEKSYNIKEILKSCDLKKYKYLDLCPFANLTVSVHNTGVVSSDFVVLSFVAGEYGPKPYPLKTLVAYTRLHDVKPDSKQDATLELSIGSLVRYDESGNAVLYPGKYTLLVDVPTKATVEFELVGKSVVIDETPKMDEGRLKEHKKVEAGEVAYEGGMAQEVLGNEMNEL